MNLSMGGFSSLSQPIGVKIMKARTIKVKLYRVTRTVPGQPDDAPDFMPGAAGLQTYLNSIYKPQINADFAVTDGGELKLNWDVDGNGVFDGSTPYEMEKVLAAAGPDTISNIRVFVVSGGSSIDNTDLGVTERADRTCWISGDFWRDLNAFTKEKQQILQQQALGQGNTIAHEIGHVLVGPGHPDAKATPGYTPDLGRAPLPGTDHTQRLMLSGKAGKYILSGSLLVKAEWDEAEKWMSENAK
jgi:hypothetical protein